MKPKISLIAAISENRVIGRDNQLPWHIPEDLKRFKEITKGHPVIMGRKTYESIGRLLPKRINIIVTRDITYMVDGAVMAHSLDDAIEKAQESIQYRVSSTEQGKNQNTEYGILNTDENEVFIIGGGQVFEQSISVADRLYLTIVHTTIEGDSFFPEYSAFQHEIYRRESSNENFSYTFLTLEK